MTLLEIDHPKRNAQPSAGVRRLLLIAIHPPFVAAADLCLLPLSTCSVVLLGQLLGLVLLPPFSAYSHLLPLDCLCSLAFFSAGGLYTNWLRRDSRQLLALLALASALVWSAIALACWQQVQQAAAPWLLVNLAFGQCLFLISYRLLLRRFHRMLTGPQRIMVVAGDEAQALGLIRKLEPHATGWFRIAGFSLLHELDTLRRAARTFDAILLAPGCPDTEAAVGRCKKINKPVIMVPSSGELSLIRAGTVEIDDFLVLALRQPHLTLGESALKRIIDVVLSLALLCLLGPLFLGVCVWIRLTSKGPAIFKQERVGRHGIEFTLLKFRTMVADAESSTGPILAQQSDPRITPLGQFLRATRIDEIPQLFNVLAGDMSLIGPRPERQFFVRKFHESVPDYDLRLAVKPGITGLAQVAGSYATPVEQKLKYDLLYLYDYSLFLDISILFRTILTVFQTERAEGLKVSPSLLMDEQ